MDGWVGARELDTTHWAVDRNSNDNHGLVQRPAEEKTLRSFVRSQFLLFLTLLRGYVEPRTKSRWFRRKSLEVFDPPHYQLMSGGGKMPDGPLSWFPIHYLLCVGDARHCS